MCPRSPGLGMKVSMVAMPQATKDSSEGLGRTAMPPPALQRACRCPNTSTAFSPPVADPCDGRSSCWAGQALSLHCACT